MDKEKIDQLLDDLITRYDSVVDELCSTTSDLFPISYGEVYDRMESEVNEFKQIANEISSGVDKYKLEQLLDQLITGYENIIDQICSTVADEYPMSYGEVFEQMKGKEEKFKQIANEIKDEANTTSVDRYIEHNETKKETWIDKDKIDQLLDLLIEKYDDLVDDLCMEIDKEHGGYAEEREWMQRKIDDFKSVADEIRHEAKTPGRKSDIEQHTEDEWNDDENDWDNDEYNETDWDDDDDEWDDPIE